MTEAEWLTATDPSPMLGFLNGPATRETKTVWGREFTVDFHNNRALSERKARLFACACCRHLWHLLDEEHSRRLIEEGRSVNLFEERELVEPHSDSCHNAVVLAERAADESVPPDELRRLSDAAFALSSVSGSYASYYGEELGPFENELMATGEAALAVHHASTRYPPVVGHFGQTHGAYDELDAVINRVCRAGAYLRISRYDEGVDESAPTERMAAAELLRDIVGNPFRPVTFSPSWRTDTAVSLARQMYESREFSAMPILADALQDAGCDSDDVLNHCRGPGPHVRGCWVVDLVLERV
jgi:hypothetical protein